LLFRTRQGNPWAYQKPVREGSRLRRLTTDNVSDTFDLIVRPMGLKRPGIGFYKLKHLSNSTADAAGDPHATFTLFGHSLPGVKSHYVKVSEDRVRAVTEFMRRHLILPPDDSGTQTRQSVHGPQRRTR
jgi:hypothetical protein